MGTFTNSIVFESTESRILHCYPGSEYKDSPTVIEPSEDYEIYAYVQEVEGINVRRIKVDILALEGVPHTLKLASNWNVTWYQIAPYLDSAVIERPQFTKSVANTT